MRRALVLAFCAVLALVQSTLVGVSQDVAMRPNFEQVVLSIDEEFSYSNSDWILEYRVLQMSQKFESLALLSDEYVDDCLKFLAEISHTRQQRVIAVYSMHKLSLKRWVHFANGIIDLYNQRKVTTRELMQVIFPMHGYSNHTSANFLVGDVRALLYRVRKIDELDAVEKQNINRVLFGIDYLLRLLSPPEKFE